MGDNLDKKALYQFRAEEFDKNYFSLRDIEWRRSLESLSGYAVIAVAHYTLSKSDNMAWTVFSLCAGIVLPIVLFFTYRWFSQRIQDRLHFTRDRKNQYIDLLHKEYGEQRVPEESKYPSHGNTYA